MIATVTMNPAIDRTICIKNFEIGKVNRIISTEDNVGGKGINVSKAIHVLGGDTIVLGFIGGDNGNKIQRRLWEMGIGYDFSYVNQNTRTNIKVTDIISKTSTDINDVGLPITNTILINKFINKLINYAKRSSFVCISGSLPLGMNPSFYSDIIGKISSFTKTALDCDDENLRESVKAKPFIIKPNKAEFTSAFNLEQNADDMSIIKCAKYLISEYGLCYVLLSNGKHGSMLISKNNVYRAQPIQVDIGTTVGTGDSMLGGFLYAYEKFNNEIKAFAYAAACGTASAMTYGSKVFDIETVNELMNTIVIDTLE